MARANVTLDTTLFERAISDIDQYVKGSLSQSAYRHFRAITPRRSGNAQSKTRLQSTRTGWAILADYPYAQVLDQGLYPRTPQGGTGRTSGGYSTQAPRGMSEPTLEHINRELQRNLRRYN